MAYTLMAGSQHYTQTTALIDGISGDHDLGIEYALLVSGDSVDLEERICHAAEDLLESAQDMIAEETTEPWPAKARASYLAAFRPRGPR